MPGYQYMQQYADTESAVPIDFKRTIDANTISQWGVAMTIAPGPYPPGYRIPNNQEGGGYPPSGQQSNGIHPIRLQPPTSGNASGNKPFIFFSTATITVVNETDTDGKFLWGLGVSYPSETDRPMMPFLGCFHIINDYRKMVPITIPKNSSVPLTTIRLDVLDPQFAAVPNWPNWSIVPNGQNGMWPAITPTMVNPGSVPLNIKDVLALGFAIPY